MAFLTRQERDAWKRRHFFIFGIGRIFGDKCNALEMNWASKCIDSD